jgi:probable rRNA maturation factor
MVILQKPVAQLSEGALDRFLSRAKRAAGLRGVVNVLLTNSRELQSLNRRFRGKDQPTDVLSFPPILGNGAFAGDIAISAEIAKQNARRMGHSTADEVRVLVLHGVLHLAGYDHESDNGAMEAKEQVLRKKLGLPVGLIERAHGKVDDWATDTRTKRTLMSRSRPTKAGKARSSPTGATRQRRRAR